MRHWCHWNYLIFTFDNLLQHLCHSCELACMPQPYSHAATSHRHSYLTVSDTSPTSCWHLLFFVGVTDNSSKLYCPWRHLVEAIPRKTRWWLHSLLNTHNCPHFWVEWECLQMSSRVVMIMLMTYERILNHSQSIQIVWVIMSESVEAWGKAQDNDIHEKYKAWHQSLYRGGVIPRCLICPWLWGALGALHEADSSKLSGIAKQKIHKYFRKQTPGVLKLIGEQQTTGR